MVSVVLIRHPELLKNSCACSCNPCQQANYRSNSPVKVLYFPLEFFQWCKCVQWQKEAAVSCYCSEKVPPYCFKIPLRTTIITFWKIEYQLRNSRMKSHIDKVLDYDIARINAHTKRLQ